MSKEHAYAYEAGYRDGSTHYELEHCPACKNVADLQAAMDENEELRKLCADMWKKAVMGMDFANRLEFIGEFAYRMRKLEVDAPNNSSEGILHTT